MGFPRWFMVDDDGGSEGPPQCFYADPLPYAPEWDFLVLDLANPQVDLYGFLGFPSGRQNDNPALNPTANWDLCPFVDYCDGPDIEGITQPGRYLQRWRVRLDPTAFGTQSVVYGKAGDPVQPANPLLFPAPLVSDATWISISFDANALPAFAFQYDNAGTPTIEVRRMIAGVPTTFTWAGVSPRLFFDGVLQRDPSLTDLICFYVNAAGELCGRFQRENMAVEHVLGTTGLGGGIRNLTKTDREQSYQRVYYWTGTDEMRMYRSAVYPPFPIYVTERLDGVLSPPTGTYAPGVVDGGTYGPERLDAELLAVSGAYMTAIVPSGPYQERLDATLPAVSGAYTAIIVPSGPYQERLDLTLPVASGAYMLVIVDGGSYAERMDAALSPPTGTYSP